MEGERKGGRARRTGNRGSRAGPGPEAARASGRRRRRRWRTGSGAAPAGPRVTHMGGRQPLEHEGHAERGRDDAAPPDRTDRQEDDSRAAARRPATSAPRQPDAVGQIGPGPRPAVCETSTTRPPSQRLNGQHEEGRGRHGDRDSLDEVVEGQASRAAWTPENTVLQPRGQRPKRHARSRRSAASRAPPMSRTGRADRAAIQHEDLADRIPFDGAVLSAGHGSRQQRTDRRATRPAGRGLR